LGRSGLQLVWWFLNLLLIEMPQHAFKIIPTPLGDLIAMHEEGALTGLYFTDQSELSGGGDQYGQPASIYDSPLLKEVTERSSDPLLCKLASQIDAYFDLKPARFDIPLKPKGTLFQQVVWNALKQVPYGSSLSYGELAHTIQRPRAVRAVGQAVGANPWIIVVPCHRVLAAGGKLGGFSSGIERKKALLKMEGLL